MRYNAAAKAGQAIDWSGIIRLMEEKVGALPKSNSNSPFLLLAPYDHVLKNDKDMAHIQGS